jgi:CRISPR-associated protein Csa1
MYFLSEVDRKKLIGRTLPTARSTGVSEDLRGWSWHKSPMKPVYEERIPMYSVCSKYCPTSRDVFLDRVKRAKPHPSESVILGVALHRVVGAVVNGFLDGNLPSFDRWYEDTLRSRGVSQAIEGIKEKSRSVWNYAAINCDTHVRNRSSEQPYASRRDVLATAIPFLVEHRLTGELLGLSGLLSVDCYDYLRGIVFDLKVAWDEQDWYRLTPTGYAIVLESVYEVPVDVGCILYLWFQGDNLVTKRDLFFINDDLRSWWIEERDAKQTIVAQRKEPSIASQCYSDCIYYEPCRGEPHA